MPASLIEHVARIYGRGPSLLWLGQGLQRQPRGGNVMRAIAMLPALTGNIRRPGSGFLYLNGSDSRGVDWDWLVGADLAAPGAPGVRQPDGSGGGARRSRSEPRARLLEHQPRRLEPGAGRSARALERDDLLTVVCDLFLTDTAAYADYVLPAAGFLECDDILPSYFHHTLSAQVKAVEPPGHALRNSEIFRRLAAGMGFDEAGAAGGRCRADRAPAGPVGRELGGARARRHRSALRRAARPVPRRIPDAERAHRDRVGECRGRRAPAPARTERRRAARRPATCDCSRRRRRGS